MRVRTALAELGYDRIADRAAQRFDLSSRLAEARRVDTIGEDDEPAHARYVEPDRCACEAGVTDGADARPAIARLRDAGCRRRRRVPAEAPGVARRRCIGEEALDDVRAELVARRHHRGGELRDIVDRAEQARVAADPATEEAVLVVDEPGHDAALVELGRDGAGDGLGCEPRGETERAGDQIGERLLERAIRHELDDPAELDAAEVAVDGSGGEL